MGAGWIATSGDGSDCGHCHRTKQAAGHCVRAQIYAGRADARQEAAEHGIPYRRYVAQWSADAIYWRDCEGNLHHDSAI